jgi:excisionase family DNA binding protein
MLANGIRDGDRSADVRAARRCSRNSVRRMIESSAPPSARLLTADELADRWQVSKQQVYRLGREGRIPVVLIGRYMRFREASIEAWERSQEGATDG